ncbi:type III secretion system gatekeeper subunit SctW [uncultured Bilophila sp.]|uniref:type III secretion system gatekeeper subunit SctW n=1 Tax=uncultured Bilophila sp. TaxID=529385 RepID=UPI0025D062E3|nr:type III secretion system gatekeeper subunit SctW [uncultured Bilophila sp.]
MSIDFSVNNQMGQMATGAASSAGALAAGSLMGNAAVQVEDPMSLLADAAEELTFAADTTDEFELEDRKERERAEESLAERVKLYQDLMHEAGKAQDIDRLKDSLRAREGREKAAREALYRFPDPSDAYAALSDALESLSNDPSVDPAVLEDVRQGLAELEAEHGPRIRSGIQGALAAAGYADLDGTDNLRDLYRQTVCDFTDVNAAFAHIHEKYGDVGFDKAMDFLFNALSNDLATDVPSMETTHLENVHANLEQVRLLQSTHVQCERLLQRWESVHGVADAALTPMELLGDMVNLRNENFLGAMHIDRIAAKAKAPDIERQVLFLQELLNMTRNLPVRLFDGEQGRMKVLDAVQEAVDNAIQREDEYLANLGDA